MNIVSDRKLSIYLFWAGFALLLCLSACAMGVKIKEFKEIKEEAAVSGPESAAIAKALPKTEGKIKAGEKLKFSIRWMGMEVGTADVEVKGIEEIKGRKAYHIAVFARSNSVIDLVYPVRDEHHSYVDAEHFYSLRYEKILNEGRYQADEVTEFDQEQHKGLYLSRRSGDKKQMMIPKDVQDQVSGAFWFRAQNVKPGDTLTVPISADEKNWNLEVKIYKKEIVSIKEIGSFEAVRLEPLIKFQGVFVRRGKMTGWMSLDEKRLPLMMTTKIPVLGSIQMVLVSYEGS